MDKSEEQHF